MSPLLSEICMLIVPCLLIPGCREPRFPPPSPTGVGEVVGLDDGPAGQWARAIAGDCVGREEGHASIHAVEGQDRCQRKVRGGCA